MKKFTFKSVEETKNIISEFEKAPHQRLAQHKIAEELTVLVHGREAYEGALRISKALFSGDIGSLNIDEIKDGFKDVPSITVTEDKNIVDLLLEANLASSKRESREFIKNNAISINGEKINDLDFIVRKEDAIGNEFTVIRRGKKKYALVKH